MGKDLLSNEEIDTLLELFRAEGAELQEEEIHELKEAVQDVLDTGLTVSPVDLLKPNRFSGEQLDAVERYCAGLAQGIGALLTDRLRLDLVCDCVGAEQLRFGHWHERVGTPAAVYLLGVEGHETPMPLTLSPSLLHGAVDRILGGLGQAEEPLGEPTEAMFTVMQSLVDALGAQIGRSLGELMRGACRLERRLNAQGLAQIVGSNDVVLAVYLQVSGERLHGDVHLVLPFAQAEALASQLGHSRTPDYDASPGSSRQALSRGLREVELPVRAVLGRPRITLRELMALQQGDVLQLPTRLGDSLEVQVAERTKFRASPGRRGSHWALRIEQEETHAR